MAGPRPWARCSRSRPPGGRRAVKAHVEARRTRDRAVLPWHAHRSSRATWTRTAVASRARARAWARGSSSCCRPRESRSGSTSRSSSLCGLSPFRLARPESAYRVADSRTADAYPVRFRRSRLVLAHDLLRRPDEPRRRPAGNYLGIYVSNSCLFWACRALARLQVLHDGHQRRRRRGVAQERRGRRRGRAGRARRVRLDLHAPEHRLPLRGRRPPRADPRAAPVRAVRAGDPARVGGFIGVQAMPVPARKFGEYDALIEAGADHFSFCYEFEDPEHFARLCPGQGGDAGPERLLRGDGVHGEEARRAGGSRARSSRVSSRSRRRCAAIDRIVRGRRVPDGLHLPSDARERARRTPPPPIPTT